MQTKLTSFLLKKNKRLFATFSFLIVCSLSLCAANNVGLLNSHAMNHPNKVYNQSTKGIRVSLDYVDSIRKFTADIFEARWNSNGKDKNFVMPPFALANTMYNLYEGATGKTKEQIGTALYIDESKFNHLSETNKNLNNIFKNHDDGFGSNIYNGMFFDDNVKNEIKDEYINLLTDSYYSDIYHGDFNTDEIEQLSSEYVKEVTNNHFNSYSYNYDLPRGNMRMFSSARIKTNWVTSNGENYRKISEPYLFNNCDETTTIKEEYISFDTTALILTGEDYLVASFRLNSSFSFNVLFPNEGTNYQEVIKNNIYNSLCFPYEEPRVYGYVYGSMPIFNTSDSYLFNYLLQDLGVDDLITNNEFTNVTNDEVKIQGIKYASDISINEYGVFGTKVEKDSDGPIPIGSAGSGSFHLHINHPFAYSITSYFDIPILLGQVVSLF